MRDIWAFLIETLTASGVAAFILVIKALLQDKLPPRWQFSIWGLLGIVLLLPAGAFGTYVLFDWPLLIETLKSYGLGIYDVTRGTAPVPLLPKALPSRITDWIFIIYAAGVLFFMVRYLVSYIRLRLILRRGKKVQSDEIIAEVREKYKLPGCRTVRVPGLQTAFVCGVFKPVLALPAGKEVDEKVILHELLHLKYRDVVWGVIISFFRCIHWCNPFLWYCADRAMNDMESLCDQRVLERLQGEERRDYGKILLSMANDQYARAPGTSSAANGGKNIQRRIEAIARFKKYPGGMALVSVCILVVLVSPLLAGTADRSSLWKNLDDSKNRFSRFEALSAARLTPCITAAGALDTYAKAILTDNGVYRAMCMQKSQQEQAMAEIGDRIGSQNLGWKSGAPEALDRNAGYYVYNVRNISSTHLEVLLVMKTQAGPRQPGNMRLCIQNVALNKEGNHWYAEPMDDFRIQEMLEESLSWGCRELPSVTYQAQAGDFLVKVCYQQNYEVDNWQEPASSPMDLFHGESSFQQQAKPGAEFSTVHTSVWHALTYVGDQEKKDAITQVGLSTAEWNGDGERPSLNSVGENEISGSSNSGEIWDGVRLKPGWEDEIQLNGGGSGDAFDGFDNKMPKCFAADLYVNGEKTAEVTLYPQEGTP